MSNSFLECDDSSSPVTANHTQTLQRLTPELFPEDRFFGRMAEKATPESAAESRFSSRLKSTVQK